jgi:hypothetical protein
MYNTAILVSENKGLMAVNKQKKRKKAKKRSYITTETVLTVEEGVCYVEERDTAANAETEAGLSEVKTCVPCRYSKYGSYNHTACTCQQ